MSSPTQCLSFEYIPNNLLDFVCSLWACFCYVQLYHKANSSDVDLFSTHSDGTKGQLQRKGAGNYQDKSANIGSKSTPVEVTPGEEFWCIEWPSPMTIATTIQNETSVRGWSLSWVLVSPGAHHTISKLWKFGSRLKICTCKKSTGSCCFASFQRGKHCWLHPCNSTDSL